MNAHTPEIRPFTISACTIARNEEKNIARSIQSYRDFVDEIVVVDTGSTDRTAEIARQMGARVVHFDWCGDFAAARNFALGQVNGDWIVFLDADEYFSKNAGFQVRRSIETARRNGYNMIQCRWLNLDSDQPEKKLPAGTAIRILKSGVSYRHRIHEEPNFPGGRKILFAEKWRFFLYHTGYSSHISKKKAERNLPLLLREIEEESDENRRMVDQSYLSDGYFALRDFDKCRDASEKYIRFSRKNGIVMMGNAAKPYLNLMACLEVQDAPLAEQLKWVNEFEAAFPHFPDAVFAGAKLDLRRRRLLSAERRLRQVLELADSYDGTEPCQLQTVPELCHFHLGQTLARQGRDSDALVSLFQAWRIQPAFTDAAEEMMRLTKHTPAPAADRFLHMLFENREPARRRTVLGGLMRQYMSGYLKEWYAALKLQSDAPHRTFDALPLAYIAAGSGNYAGAARLFAAEAAEQKEKDGKLEMQALLCAWLAGDVPPVTLSAANPALAVALGLLEGKIQAGDLAAVAGMTAEAGRMCGPARAADMAEKIAGRMKPTLWREFAVRLERAEEFAGALRVAQKLRPDAESAFLIGYYAMQSRRPGEAALAFEAAASLGCDDPALPECRSILKRTRGQADPSAAARAAEWIQAGAFDRALADVLAAVARAGADPELCSLASVSCLQLGRAHMALLAAQAGLASAPQYADLQVNAGDACLALGDRAGAAGWYETAARTCGDPALQADLSRQVAELASAARSAG